MCTLIIIYVFFLLTVHFLYTTKQVLGTHFMYWYCICEIYQISSKFYYFNQIALKFNKISALIHITEVIKTWNEKRS